MTNFIAHTLSTDQLEFFEREGYLIVRALYSDAEVAAIREHFMALHASGPVEGWFNPVPLEESGGDLLQHYPRVVHPHRFDAQCRQWMLDGRIGAITRDLFGDEPLAAQSMFYFKPPGARGQALHQDDFYLRTQPGACIASWLAVDAADRENGGLFVVPGSHRIEVLCPQPADMSRSFTIEEVEVPAGLAPVPADLAAGDVLFFNGSVIHGSWPNTSPNRFRRSFICHYVAASTLAMSGGYSPLVDFDGNEVGVGVAAGGGPCGSEELAQFERAKAQFKDECRTGILQGAIAP